MKLVAGIDAGSRAIKIVLMHADSGEVAASGICDQGVEQNTLAESLFNRLLDKCGASPSDIAQTIATGYGRHNIERADTTITEITCHAKGVAHLVPEAKTVIEIGGQDSKVLHLDGNGSVRDFSMNDRCAAGTGRFMEIVANRLELDFDNIGEIVQRSQNPATISSMCVVFAETEIVGLLASGVPAQDILAGVQKAMVSRVAGMAGRNPQAQVAFTGGVALIPGMATALEATLKCPVQVADDPQMTGALGAALLGRPSRR